MEVSYIKAKLGEKFIITALNIITPRHERHQSSNKISLENITYSETVKIKEVQYIWLL